MPDISNISTEELLRLRDRALARNIPTEKHIEIAAKETGVPAQLISKIVRVESSGNPDAISHAGAKGLMQLMDKTARQYGVTDSFNPSQNIMAGTRHLKDLLDTFGDTTLALAAYNAGSTAVRRYKGIPPFKETQDYVRKVLGVGAASEKTDIKNVPTEQLLEMQKRKKTQGQAPTLASLRFEPPREAMQPELSGMREQSGSDQSPSGLASMRFEPPAQPAVTTYAPTDPERDIRGSLQPEIQERELGWGETAKALGLGLVRGAIDVDPHGGSVLSRAVYPYRDEPVHRIGEAAGLLAPYTGAAKVVSGVSKAPQLAKAAAKLPGMVRAGIRGAATGATAAGVRETGRAIQGREADMSQIGKEAALFGAADIALRGGGRVLKKLIKAKPKPVAKPVVEAVEPVSEASKQLVVNKTYAPTPKGMKPYKILRYPEVKRGELDVMMKIPMQQPKRLVGKVAEAVENPIRMHEKLGTKELMYHETRAVENNATRRIKKAAEQFKGITKTLPFGSRSKSSERIMTHAIAQQRGGVKILEEMGVTDIPKLNPNEASVYKYMRSELENLYGELQQARMAAGLKPFPKVENYFTFFRTIDGELQAGRDIIHVDPSKVLRNKLRTEKTPFRFAKRRMLDDYGPVELDAIGVFERYSQSALRHIEMTPQVARLRQLLDGEFVNGFKLEMENPEAYRQLNDWANFVSGVDVHNLPKVVERGLRKINRNLAYAVLSYNLRSAAIQPTAILNAVTEIGPKYIQKGVQGLFNRQTRRLIMEKSNTLLGRKHDIAIADMMQGLTGKFGGVKKKARPSGVISPSSSRLRNGKSNLVGCLLERQGSVQIR